MIRSRHRDTFLDGMGRPPARRRPEAEITALAVRLAQDWTPGDLVFTWLRRHVAELTRMVRDDGWSWPDVARALDAAGITYRTGRPWTGRLLTIKAVQARKAMQRPPAPSPDPASAMTRALKEALDGLGTVQQLHIHMGTAATMPLPPATAPARTEQPGPAPSRPSPPEQGARDLGVAPSLAASGEDEGPRFELASFADGWTPPPLQPEQPAGSKPPPKPKRRFDPDEVLRRLDGDSAPPSKEGKDE